VPLAVFILTRLDFAPFAAGVIILSKWRMFAVRPRFWASNLRANSVDIMVGISAVIFMTESDSVTMQLVWTALYTGWLLVIKPRSSGFMVAMQAFIGQFCGLTAMYLAWGDGPLAVLTLGTGLICFWAARHFFDGFDEPYAKMLSLIWGYFGVCIGWLMGHWLILYSAIAIPTVLLSAIGYSLASMYYLDHEDKLSKGVRRQIVFIAVIVAALVCYVLATDWRDKVV
jgi:hypothetical protein